MDYSRVIEVLNSVYAVDGNFQPSEIQTAIDTAIRCVRFQQLRYKNKFLKPNKCRVGRVGLMHKS